MAEHAIPVDLRNPGQVFACLGFLEAADVLLGDAEGGFDWSDEVNVTFRLHADGKKNPVAAVLEFLSSASVERLAPTGYVDPSGKTEKGGSSKAGGEADGDEESAGQGVEAADIRLSETFPAPEGDRMSLPILLESGNRPPLALGHWADGSSRNSFKLYAGNRSAAGIARAMLLGVREKAKKGQTAGNLKSKGIRQLWEERRDDLVACPLHVLTPMGGSFNFDPRGAWTAIDAGYSPNDQGHQIESSPVVELLAAWGLENARPNEFATRKVRYAAWGVPLSPMLARAALCGTLVTVPLKCFRFALDMSGKNKVVTFGELETQL
jgi:CRISPR-associated protein Csb3